LRHNTILENSKQGTLDKFVQVPLKFARAPRRRILRAEARLTLAERIDALTVERAKPWWRRLAAKANPVGLSAPQPLRRPVFTAASHCYNAT